MVHCLVPLSWNQKPCHNYIRVNEDHACFSLKAASWQGSDNDRLICIIVYNRIDEQEYASHVLRMRRGGVWLKFYLAT